MLSVTPSKRPLFDPVLDHFLTIRLTFGAYRIPQTRLFYQTAQHQHRLVNICAMTTCDKVASHAGLPVLTLERANFTSNALSAQDSEYS